MPKLKRQATHYDRYHFYILCVGHKGISSKPLFPYLSVLADAVLGWVSFCIVLSGSGLLSRDLKYQHWFSLPCWHLVVMLLLCWEMTRRYTVWFFCVSLFSLSGLTPCSTAVTSWGRIGFCPPIIQLWSLVVVPEPGTAVTNRSVVFKVLYKANMLGTKGCIS